MLSQNMMGSWTDAAMLLWVGIRNMVSGFRESELLDSSLFNRIMITSPDRSVGYPLLLLVGSVVIGISREKTHVA